MATDMNVTATAAATGPYEAPVLAKIAAINYLPTTIGVAIRFMELGKNPDTEPREYAHVLRSDSSLATKLLSLANSSWFGVRNRVTRVEAAVNLLGLATVRTLSVSYCITGLHHELRLTREEARLFWTSALCKAVAAQQFAQLHDPGLGEEAFTAGLFEDLAIPFMYAVAPEQMQAMLRDVSSNWHTHLGRDRQLFRLDHTDLGRIIVQKLELPEVFIDAVAFHHDHQRLRECIPNEALADAVYLAGLFPHLADHWNPGDAAEMKEFIAARGHGADPVAFLASVQKEFDRLDAFFDEKSVATLHLLELLECAGREAADNTTRLVGNVQELMQQAATAGLQVHDLMAQQSEIELAAATDPLTGASNRDGFYARARDVLVRADRYSIPFALVFLHIDCFKQINDTQGHAQGDQTLRRLVALVRQIAGREGVVGRIGGDEFLVLMLECTPAQAEQRVRSVLSQFAEGGQVPLRATLSAGMVWAAGKGKVAALDELIALSDNLMYQSKRSGGNHLNWKTVD